MISQRKIFCLNPEIWLQYIKTVYINLEDWPIGLRHVNEAVGFQFNPPLGARLGIDFHSWSEASGDLLGQKLNNTVINIKQLKLFSHYFLNNDPKLLFEQPNSR